MTVEFENGYNQAIKDAMAMLRCEIPSRMGGTWNTEQMRIAANYVGGLHRPAIIPADAFTTDDAGNLIPHPKRGGFDVEDSALLTK